ncbi:hypothetical protein CQW23_00207 [Capsicum baccatum]|uniref:F-box associated beta-propeller type 3 domain-containing protein n=1 Tax=Capsicum baccatum TaxID=33114 RepID=A0A2G2XK19_CAPBA|nr:hypothetical protein CQW23_00207 [Capsicum baccatum]
MFTVNYRGAYKWNFKEFPVRSLFFDSVTEAFDLDCPIEYDRKYVGIEGSCNGLILLADSEGYSFLWNPSTRKYKTLPYFTSRWKTYLVKYGFGYDELHDDYKVVGVSYKFIMRPNDISDDTEVKIYSLKIDSWTNVDYCDEIFLIKKNVGYCWVTLRDPGLFVDGKIRDIEEVVNGQKSLESELIQRDLDCPIEYDRKYIRILGSCNGLIFLANSEGYSFLWNPTTRKYKTLPYFTSRWKKYIVSYGFGYDELHDDYKVVGVSDNYIMRPNGISDDTEVKIYSLKSDSWTNVDYCDEAFLIKKNVGYGGEVLHHDGVFVNGKIRYVEEVVNDQKEFGKERFQTTFATSRGASKIICKIFINAFRPLLYTTPSLSYAISPME